MTEQEIMDILIQNREKGIAFGFLPVEVQEWCKARMNQHIFNVYRDDEWFNGESCISCSNSHIYTLTKDYKPKPRFDPHFVEFDIDKNGYFYYEGKQYYYRDDVAFEKRHSYIFKGFGGWLYTTDNKQQVWSTVPFVLSDNDNCAVTESNEEAKPIYPTKIRFWRYAE